MINLPNNAISVVCHIKKKRNSVNFQRRIKDFPEGGTNPKGGPHPIVLLIFPKTAWTWMKFDRGDVHGFCPILTREKCTSTWHTWNVNHLSPLVNSFQFFWVNGKGDDQEPKDRKNMIFKAPIYGVHLLRESVILRPIHTVWQWQQENCFSCELSSGADPGFLIGGVGNIQICQIFPKKLHEIKKNLVWWGRGEGRSTTAHCYPCNCINYSHIRCRAV